MGNGLSDKLVSGCLPAGKARCMVDTRKAPIKKRKTKMYCHPKCVAIKPPAVGAIMGDTAITSISIENTFAIWSAGNRSLTYALAATIPAHPPSPCNSRKKISILSELTKIQMPDASRYKAIPAYSGGFRP